MPLSSMRLLSRIARNLPSEFFARNESVTPLDRHVPIVESSMNPSSMLESRLARIELLLEKILTQRRVSEVMRDDDDMITKVINRPLSDNE